MSRLRDYQHLQQHFFEIKSDKSNKFICRFVYPQALGISSSKFPES